jgi:hypothetical protein
MIDKAAAFCSGSELTPLARLEANEGGLRVPTKTLHNYNPMKTNPSLKLFQPAVAAALAIVIASGLSVRSAQAGYIVTLEQVGPNVVATGSGVFDLTGLFFFFNASVLSQIGPSAALIYTGPTTVQPVTLYNGLSGPTSFGTGGVRSPAAAAEIL